MKESTQKNIFSTNGKRVIRKLYLSQMDKKILSDRSESIKLNETGFYDCRQGVIKKPWGYEYLIYKNDRLAVWILYIRHGAQTSMHCHPLKKTSITVLSGEAQCSTLDDKAIRLPAQGIQYGPGVFHRTRSTSEEGSFIMEIETPNNKSDLMRFEDDYGREELGCESIDQISNNVQNDNYISFIPHTNENGVTKRLGHCNIELNYYLNLDNFQDVLKAKKWDIANILKGQLSGPEGQAAFNVCDMIDRHDIENHPRLITSEQLEVLFVREVKV